MARDLYLEAPAECLWQTFRNGMLRGRAEVESVNVDGVSQRMLADASRTRARLATRIAAEVSNTRGLATVHFQGNFRDALLEALQPCDGRFVHTHRGDRDFRPSVNNRVLTVARQGFMRLFQETLEGVEWIGIPSQGIVVRPDLPLGELAPIEPAVLRARRVR